jgi:hypothetical protein
MKRYLSLSVIARVVASALLFWALARHQYGYFVLLRWVVSGVSVYCGYLSYTLKRIPWAWVFGFSALLFNPIALVRIDRQTWAYLDIATGIILLISIFFIRESIQTKGESNV